MSINNELEWLARLHQNKYLTDEEFHRAKTELLESQVPKPMEPPAGPPPPKHKWLWLSIYLLSGLLLLVLLCFFSLFRPEWLPLQEHSSSQRIELGRQFQQRGAQFEKAFQSQPQ